ncbi:MAG: NAD(P)-binding domain-containing protein [Acidobacteriota bacterium]
MYDLIIVGSGPAGLAGALRARDRGLDYVVLERGALANTVYSYPIGDVLFSSSDEVEIDSGSLPIDRKPTREELLDHYRLLVIRRRIEVRVGEEARSLTSGDGHLLVRTTSGVFRAQAVLAAIGGFGRRRLLNVPGEVVSRVSYRFIEAHPFALKQVLVIGGGNSAAEAALFLAKAGADVTLAIRRADIRRGVEPQDNVNSERGSLRATIKPWVLDPLETAAREGGLRILTSTEILEVLSGSALLRTTHNGVVSTFEVKCDHIFALLGADPDTSLLETAGARMADDGRPVYSQETFETTIPGLFVAGHVTRDVHIKNAIRAARRVVDYIAESVEQRMACRA